MKQWKTLSFPTSPLSASFMFTKHGCDAVRSVAQAFLLLQQPTDGLHLCAASHRRSHTFIHRVMYECVARDCWDDGMWTLDSHLGWLGFYGFPFPEATVYVRMKAWLWNKTKSSALVYFGVEPVLGSFLCWAMAQTRRQGSSSFELTRCGWSKPFQRPDEE